MAEFIQVIGNIGAVDNLCGSVPVVLFSVAGSVGRAVGGLYLKAEKKAKIFAGAQQGNVDNCFFKLVIHIFCVFGPVSRPRFNFLGFYKFAGVCFFQVEEVHFNFANLSAAAGFFVFDAFGVKGFSEDGQ